jgi:putative FmdB family regulatory protein
VPTYDYQCRSCGTITEVVHSMLEEGPSTCDRCGGELRRVIHPTGIIFRGGGFYKTDSRSSSSGSVGGSGRGGSATPADGNAATPSPKESTKEKGTTSTASGDAKGSGGGD